MESEIVALRVVELQMVKLRIKIRDEKCADRDSNPGLGVGNA